MPSVRSRTTSAARVPVAGASFRQRYSQRDHAQYIQEVDGIRVFVSYTVFITCNEVDVC